MQLDQERYIHREVEPRMTQGAVFSLDLNSDESDDD